MSYPNFKCDTCGDTGKIEVLEHVTGDNIIEGGFYEGSGTYKRCPECNIEDELQDEG